MAKGGKAAQGFARGFQSLPHWLQLAQDRRRQELYDVQIRQRIEETRRRMEVEEAEAEQEERVYGEKTATWHALPLETQEAFFVPGKIPRMTALGMATTLKDVEPGIAARIEAAAGPYATTGEGAAPPGSYEQKVEEARLYNQAIAGDSQAFMNLPEDKQQAVKSFLDVRVKLLDIETKRKELTEPEEPKKRPAVTFNDRRNWINFVDENYGLGVEIAEGKISLRQINQKRKEWGLSPVTYTDVDEDARRLKEGKPLLIQWPQRWKKKKVGSSFWGLGADKFQLVPGDQIEGVPSEEMEVGEVTNEELESLKKNAVKQRR